mmetsp:Transcript_8222/g.25403  ORF Transcript_8222/g.25403 Transcript_8222/m.25403 type:complete len:270 (+) Transcript_8222:1104-1913(+)
MTSLRIALDSSASLPPFRIRPQPVRRANDAICASASGRASKITRTTPKAHVRFSRIRPGLSSRRSTTFCTGSSLSASACVPLATASSFFPDNPRRCRMAGSTSPEFATSRAFAARIASRCSPTASATLRSNADRCSPLSACSAREASRTRVSVPNNSSSSPSIFFAVPLTFLPFRRCCCLDAEEKKRVPTSSPLKIFETTSGSWPDASATHLTPPRTARFAAATLASMPPRPLSDLSPNTMASSSASSSARGTCTVSMRRAPWSVGGRS